MQLLSLRGEGGVTVRGGVVNITAGGRIGLSGQVSSYIEHY